MTGGGTSPVDLSRLRFPHGILPVHQKNSALWAGGLALVFAGVLGACAMARIVSGSYGLLDFAVFHSALLNTTRGEFYFTYLYPHGPLFYQHFDPVIFLLLPFYWLLGKAAWLILPLSLSFAVGAGILGLWRVGRQEGLGPRAALIIPLLAALNAPLHNIIMYDFHPFVFCFPLLIWGWLFLREGRCLTGSLLWVLAVLCKENVPLVVAGLGISLALEGHRRRGLLWAAAGGFFFLVLTKVLIPSFAEAGASSVYLVRYQWIGDGMGGVMLGALRRPFYVAQVIFSRQETLKFFANLLLPLFFLPLLAPRRLVGMVPEFAILLLSSFQPMWSMHFHYQTAVLAVLLLASVRGLVVLRDFSAALSEKHKHRRFLKFLPHTVVLAALVFSSRVLYEEGRSLPFHKYQRIVAKKRGVPDPRRSMIRELGELVPEEASVSVPDHFLSPVYSFVTRRLIAIYPDRSDIADYLILDTRRHFYSPLSQEQLHQRWDQLLHSPDFEVLFSKEDISIFRRKEPRHPDPEDKRQAWIHKGPLG